MNKRIFSTLALAVIVFTIVFPLNVQAKSPLDDIHDYEVQVDMRDDGSCDLTYHIEWEVLDSKSEGPLTWIKVGIPNEYADEFEAISDNIDDIYYYEDWGDYVRLDLDKKYKQGQVLKLDFTFHQMNLFELKSDGAYYEFTPGWFEDTPVDKMVIRWNADNVETVEGNPKLVDGYYVWTNTDGGYNVKETVNLVYDENQYDYLAGNVTDKARYDDDNYTTDELKLWSVLMLVFPIAGFAIVIILIKYSKKFREDGYSDERGLGVNYYSARNARRYHHTNGGGRACACACACACAGGGRAGCSRKDFYGTKLYTKDIYAAIESHS
ncbi:MAG: hypothetical protein IKP29_07275 [Pseudobutyrivibrio sp.]|nr:hypothetical protein [Pseudobutyrivibrio sp.]